jgi:hypothetical protein
MQGICVVVAVLEAVALRNCRGVDQMHRVAVIHQPVDQRSLIPTIYRALVYPKSLPLAEPFAPRRPLALYS